MDSLVTYAVPALVAVLTAAGAVIGVHFREADAYERRRGFWQLLLIVLAALSTWFAGQSAANGGELYEIAIMAGFGAVAVIAAHLLWRRLVPEAEPRTRRQALTAAVAAVVVIAAWATFGYLGDGAGCRQVQPLLQASAASSGAILPAITPSGQGPTAGDYAEWAKVIGEQAQQVTTGTVAESARTIADLANQIADAERTNDKTRHAVLGAKYYDELVRIQARCPSK